MKVEETIELGILSELSWAQCFAALFAIGIVALSLRKEKVKALHGYTWGQLATAICGVGVVALTLLAEVIQQEADDTRDMEVAQMNAELLRVAKDNYQLTQQSRLDQKELFEIAQGPDPRLVSGRIVDGKTYYLVVKNHGQSTAENVKLVLDYSYASQCIAGRNELPPDASFKFEAEVFPLDRIPAMADAYVETKKLLANGSKSLIVHITLMYDWQGQTDTSSQYTLIYDGNELLVY
jgi:hypothetical protein